MKVVISILTCLSACSAYCVDLTITFLPSPDKSVIGYNVYWGAKSNTYTNSVDVGTNTSCVVSNWPKSSVFYASATSYNSSKMESDFAKEAVWRQSDPPILNLVRINKVRVGTLLIAK